MSKGFRDKLYWREFSGVWHCHKKTVDENNHREFRSLCGKTSVGLGCLNGQDIRRPVPYLRCGLCDGREMERRMWDFSGPTTHPEKG